MVQAHGHGKSGSKHRLSAFPSSCKKSCLLHAAKTHLFQSNLPQFSLPQLNDSLIASFQPVPQETLALLPRWHFAHALIQKTAAGVKLGLVTPSDEGVLHPSLPSQSRSTDAWRGSRRLAACRRCRWIPHPLYVASFFLYKVDLWDQVCPCGFLWWLLDDRKSKRREKGPLTDTFGCLLLVISVSKIQIRVAIPLVGAGFRFWSSRKISCKKEFPGRLFQLFFWKKMATIIKFQNLFWATVVCHWHPFSGSSPSHLETVPGFKWVVIITCFTLISWYSSAQPMSRGRKELAESFRSSGGLWSDSCNDWRCMFPIQQGLGKLESLV